MKPIPASELGQSSVKFTTTHVTGHSTENLTTFVPSQSTENFKSKVNFTTAGVNDLPFATTRVFSQSTVNLTTADVLGCLNSSSPSRLTLEADEVWLSVDYTGNTRGSPLLRTRATCRLLVSGRHPWIMSLLVFNATCFSANRLVVHSTMLDRNRYDCDPARWMAPGTELVMKSNMADVSIDIKDVQTAFSLRARFRSLPENKSKKLELRKVTEHLGMYILVHTLYTYKHICIHIESFRPEWYICKIIYNRDIPFWSETLDLYTCTHTHTYTHTRARTRVHTHFTHTHTCRVRRWGHTHIQTRVLRALTLSLSLSLSLSLCHAHSLT